MNVLLYRNLIFLQIPQNKTDYSNTKLNQNTFENADKKAYSIQLRLNYYSNSLSFPHLYRGKSFLNISSFESYLFQFFLIFYR